MEIDLKNITHPFFIGVAGAGMSAIAQYLQSAGLQVSGSDRFFNEGKAQDIQRKLAAEGIRCFLQNGDGITPQTDLVVVSTAIEDSVPEVQKAKALNIPIIRRSELLALIALTKKTIAIGGTSGKSTTTAMLFDIMTYAGLSPSVITGAGLISLIQKGKIGNAFLGKSDWLIIEADESDGSIVQYHPEIGVLLNVEKDHKELTELTAVFKTFQQNSKQFIVNHSNQTAKSLSVNAANDFSIEDMDSNAGYKASGFSQKGFQISFILNGQKFSIHIAGKHNMENAVAASVAAALAGVSLEQSAAALNHYEGIYRRAQVLGEKEGVWVVDDFAHNPVKCAAAIRACQPMADKLVAWFQPHGYTPTKFLKQEFIEEIAKALRDQDEIWMSEIFYAGGTTVKDISANDLVQGIQAKGKNAFFVQNRNNFLQQARNHLTANTVLLLMGARDPSLETFAKEVYNAL